jgi:glycosyltransferase involved in cell wall biosynthesis
LDHLSDALSHRPPTIIHAFSGDAAETAVALASAFDSDLFFHVSSMADADAIGQMNARTVSKFLAVSEPLAAVVENQHSIARDRIELVRPGVQVSSDISCFADPGRAATILSMSNLTKESGVDRLIDAMDLLRKEKLSPMLFVLGDGAYESNLRALVRKRQLSAQVTFANPLGDTLSMMRSADIYVRPALDTKFTSDTLTALGTGTMVVACAGVGDHLRHEETALVCEEPTAESLARHLAAALTDRERAQRIARCGLEYARDFHGVSAMTERTIETYRAAALSRATFQIER